MSILPRFSFLLAVAILLLPLSPIASATGWRAPGNILQQLGAGFGAGHHASFGAGHPASLGPSPARALSLTRPTLWHSGTGWQSERGWSLPARPAAIPLEAAPQQPVAAPRAALFSPPQPLSAYRSR